MVGHSTVRLRGYVEDSAGASLAILEVDGRDTYLVRKDDTVSYHAGRRTVVLKVIAVSNLQIVVEVGRLRRAIVVR